MANFIVTTLNDELDAADTVAATVNLNDLSLREALALSNADEGADTITFATGPGTLTLTQGELLASTSVTIDGDQNGDNIADITVDGNNLSRVFQFVEGTSTIDALTIINGSSLGPAGAGGGLIVGIDATVTVANSTVSDNDATRGGGIRSFGTLTLVDTTVANNSATANGGGIDNYGALTLTGVVLSDNVAASSGGGLNTVDTATLTDVTLSGNEALTGGGIYNGGVLTLANTTLSGNEALAGGGIYNGGVLTLANTTVSGNEATGGGGILNGGTASLTNATLSGNTGSGILNRGTLTLDSATLSGNIAARGGGIANGGTLTVTNTIVAGNDSTADAGASADFFDFGGPETFLGVNVFSQAGVGDAEDIDGAAIGDIFAAVVANPFTGVDSGELADNGGPVQTIAIRKGGVAHDAGETAALPPADPQDLDHDGTTAEPLPVDARGVDRVFGARADVGAFEAGQFIVTTLADEAAETTDYASERADGGGLSLREALALANDDDDADFITFASNLSGGTIFLSLASQLTIATTLTIDGDLNDDGRPDITVSANTYAYTDNASNRVFQVFGEASATGITATIDGLVVRDGSENGGGGIFVGEDDTLTLINSTVTANNAGNGGGIFADGGATLILAGATVSENDATGEGGGIYGAEGSAIVVTDSAILGNRAGENGGGIYGAEGIPIAVTNSTFTGNAAGSDGGAIYGYSDNIITVVNTTITGNSAGDTGGGIYNWGEDGVTTLTNSIVAGNVAATGGNDLYGGGEPSTLVFTGANILGSEPASFTTPTGTTPVYIDGGSESGLATIFAHVALVDLDGLGGNDPFFAGVAADNGGPAWTVALNKDTTNPALDGGDDDLDPPNDARGFARHDVPGADNNDGDISDIGAFEQQGDLSFEVTTLHDELDSTAANATVESMGGEDDLSLREALFLANQDPTTADTITFDEDLIGGTEEGVDDGQLFLSSDLGELVIAGDVTVDGDITGDGAPDIIVDALGADFEVFNVMSGTSTLNGLVITGGNCDAGGGVLIGDYGLRRVFAAAYAETTPGTADLTITNSEIVGNAAIFGGGVAVGAGSSLTMINTTVAGNDAAISGGGIAIARGFSYSYAAFASDAAALVAAGSTGGTATITNSTISGNTSGYEGGGIANHGTLTLNNVTLANNQAYKGAGGSETLAAILPPGSSAGGGLFNDGIATLNNSTVTGNSAEYGGGIYAAYSCGCEPNELTINNSIVAGNTAFEEGRDLYIFPGDPERPQLEVPTVIYLGHNVFSQDDIGTANDFFEPNLANIFADIDPINLGGLLADNGGFVQTVAIVADGIAHNTGDNETLADDTADLDGDNDTGEDLPFDARGQGFPRISEDIVDIGAFEIQDQDGPPEGSTAGGTIQYVEDDLPTPLDLALTVTDPGGLTGATVAITGNFTFGQDVLSFTPQFGITGSYDPLTGVLTLAGAATDAQYQEVLRSVAYSNTSQNPSELQRTVTFEVDDGGGPVDLGDVGVDVVAVLDPPNDINGDHTTDVVWREDSGRVAVWEMNGVNVLANNFVADIPNYWHILEADSDFDGDGNSDILWRDDAGVVVLWTMNGPDIVSTTVIAGTAEFGTIPDYWHMVDTGDFTGDGRADILWREETGRVVLWEMNGGEIVSGDLVAEVPLSSEIEDTADYNGDGMNDILWRDPDGTLRIWQMDGATVVSDTTVGTIADTRHLVGSGDFNGDERFDIVWRDDDGTVTLWEMDGATIIGDSNLGTLREYWQIADIGDYTGDRNSDILWRDTTGTVVLWEMNGPTVVDATAVNTIPTHWQIEA